MRAAVKHTTFLSAVLLAGVAAATTAAPLRAQSFVTNGDFSQGLTGWTQTGWADQPRVESFDTNGLGASAAFGCNPGNNQTPTLMLEQQIIVVPGVPLEYYIDVACSASGFNNDGGQVELRLAGRSMGAHAFGMVSAAGVYRTVICGRHVATASGMQPLQIVISRTFAGLFGRTPRVYVDNMSLDLAPGPTFCMTGDRKLGSTVSLDVGGDAGARFVVFVAPQRLASGIVLGGIGTWWLEPTTTVQLLAGTLDNMGAFTTTFPLPRDPALHQVPLWFQPGQVTTANAVSLGLPRNFGLYQ